MTQPARILRNVVIAVAALIVVLIIAIFFIVQTQWFRNYVEQKIIASTEQSTGGRVGIGSFDFHWQSGQVVLTGFVLHGTEPAGAAPLLAVARIQVDFRLLTGAHVFDLTYLKIERPVANIVILPDGRSNIPTPKTNTHGPPLQSVVNAAVDHFQLSDGTVLFASGKQHLDLRGNHLQAQLWFNPADQGYRGQISLEPVTMASDRNPPVKVSLALPVEIGSNRVTFQNATLRTPESNLQVSGSIENLRDPRISAAISGRIGLSDLKNVVNLSIAPNKGLAVVDVHADIRIASNSIQVDELQLGMGNSHIDASGTLKNPRGAGALAFKGALAMGQLAGIMNLDASPAGTLFVSGTAKLDEQNNYFITGSVQGTDLSIREDKERISGIAVSAAVHADPHDLDLNGMRLSVLGGEVTGDFTLRNFSQYQVRGVVRNLNVRAIAGLLGQKQFPYDGAISGPIEAHGDLNAKPFTRGVMAQARLSLAPERPGVPISGRLFADYDGVQDNLRLENSYVALPHTRLSVSGSVDKQLSFSLTTSDLNDLLAATSTSGKSPVNLNGHQTTFAGIVTGRLTSPVIAGHVNASLFSVEDREFSGLNADATVSRTRVAVRDATLTRGSMQAQFSGQVGLENWRITPSEPISAEASIQNGDLADAAALAGHPGTDFSGALSATLRLTGTVGDPIGAVTVLASNGSIYGQPFDRIQAQADLTDQLVAIPSAFMEAGPARVNLTAQYQHPRDSFTPGQLKAHIQSNQVNLAQIVNLQKQRPNTGGILQVNMDVSGNVAPSEFLLTGLTGDVSARGLRFEGENYGDVNATARTAGQTVQYQLTSNFAGSNIQIAGNTQLARDYPSNANASVRNLPVERLLAAARRQDIPLKGNLSGTASFAGTVDNPQANVDMVLTNAVADSQPIDRVQLKGSYLQRSIDINQAEIVAGPSRIELTGRFQHPPGNLTGGTVEAQWTTNGVDLGRIHYLQVQWPGIGGTVQSSGSGSAEVRASAPKVLLTNLNAKLAAQEITAQGKNYGSMNFNASTAGGKLNFQLASDIGGASIQGQGAAQLTGDYPVNAELAFRDVDWDRLRGLVVQGTAGATLFDVSTDGRANIQGPMLQPDQLRGSIELTRLQVNSLPARAGTKPVTLTNQGPVLASMDRETVRIANAHLTGPQTDLQAQGTVAFNNRTLDLTVNANTNLSLLADFDRDITSSGSLVLAANIRGPLENPQMNGELQIHNASFNYTGISNGIYNANGLVELRGNSASVQNFSAESGGGKLTIAGFLLMTGNPRFGVRANVAGVRVQLQQGVSIVANGNINLSGTRNGSDLSGNATITRVAYSPRSDLGSFLTRAAPPIQAAGAPSPLLDNMKLDVRVRTSDALLVQSSLAQSVQGQADLRIRGTGSHPGVLGRITITEGTLTFFGSSYSVNSGTIAFYNPFRIEPVLDINLQTAAQGVNVTLHVTGPVDNLKLSYTSDPPLQFQEIIALLATGQTPTTDPTLLANQPVQPSQTFQQLGESEVLSRAVAAPVASRLQRVFGVTQLKISPTFATGTTLPGATVSLQESITSNITFTYVTTVNYTNAQIIRVDVGLTPQWSAMATRDENGILSINLIYKRQIR